MGKDLSVECKLGWKMTTVVLAVVFVLCRLDHTDKILRRQ